MKSSFLTITLAVLTALAVTLTALAAVPSTISYQGYLKDSAGVPVSAPVNVTFRLYSSGSGVNPLWSGSPQSVTPVNGIYSTQIGPTSLPFDRGYYLGVSVGSDPEMRPLQQMDAVPYALRAAIADSATAASIGTNAIADNSITSAKIVDGTVAAIDLSNGAVTSVKLAADSVDSSKILNGSITQLDMASNSIGTTQIIDGSVTDAKITGPVSAAKLELSGRVAKAGDTMTGTLNLPINGLVVGDTQLVAYANHIGIGTATPATQLSVIDSTAVNDNAAIYGEHAVTDYYGVGVYGKGGYKGVQGTVTASGGSSYTGVRGDASTSISPAAGNAYGGYFAGSNALTNYGVYGLATTTKATGTTYGGYFQATGGTNNFAMYALGDKNYFQGNVGIGTLTPGAKLHVKGSSYPNSFILVDTTAAAQDAGIHLQENGVTKSQLYWSASSQALKLLGSGGSGIEIASSGNIGVGKTPGGDKLDVSGTLRMNDNDIFVRGNGGDTGHGLGWYGYGVGRQFKSTTFAEGPVLYGFTAGALATSTGSGAIALKWNSDKSVNVYGNLGLDGTLNLGSTSSIKLNERNIDLRGDGNHGLGWYGVGKTFASQNVDGPVVFGWSGGALGTTGSGQKAALTWDTSGMVRSGPGGTGTPYALAHVNQDGSCASKSPNITSCSYNGQYGSYDLHMEITGSYDDYVILVNPYGGCATNEVYSGVGNGLANVIFFSAFGNVSCEFYMALYKIR